MKTIPLTTIEASCAKPRMTSNEAAVMQQLEALQEQHRLGLHVFEDSEPHEFPDFSHGCIYPDQESFQKDLANADIENPMMLSASLLLKPSSGKSVRPYRCHADNLPNCGYIVDLSNTKSKKGVEPARVYRAYEASLNSGSGPRNKYLQPSQPSDIQALNKIYRPFESEQALVEKVSGAEGIQMSAAQLDALGSDYLLLCRPIGDSYALNEIIISAQQSQMKAISVIAYGRNSPGANVLRHMELISGAIMGLRHLARGIDLPVVAYHVTGAECGKQTFIGQGKEPLKKVILESILAIQNDPVMSQERPFYSNDLFCDSNAIERIKNVAVRALSENGLIDSRQALEDQLKQMPKISPASCAAR